MNPTSHPHNVFHASTVAATPQPMPADPPDPESRRLREAESEARATFMLALTDLLVAHGRVQRHQAQRDSLGSQERSVPVSDIDLEALADDYVERNVSLLSAIAEVQFWDIVDGHLFPPRAGEGVTGQTTASHGLPCPAGSRVSGLTLHSDDGSELRVLDEAGQKLFDKHSPAVINLAQEYAHDAGMAGADYTEVEMAAIRTLTHAAATFQSDDPLAKPFWSYVLHYLNPAVFETLRHLGVRGEDGSAGYRDGAGPARLS